MHTSDDDDDDDDTVRKQMCAYKHISQSVTLMHPIRGGEHSDTVLSL